MDRRDAADTEQTIRKQPSWMIRRCLWGSGHVAFDAQRLADFLWHQC